MFVLPEIILIGTGVISIVGCIIQILGLIIAGRRTSTHLYIGYATLLWLVGLFTSPTFHRIYTSDIYLDYDISHFLTLLCCTMVLGNMTVLMLLFFMDYFRWIDAYIVPMMISHFILTILIAILYYYIVHLMILHVYLLVALMVMIWIVFLLIFLLHRDLECLKRRKGTDDESQLRYIIVLVFITVKIVEVILWILETIANHIFRLPLFGALAIGFSQMDSIWFLIVLLKVDHRFRTTLVEFFRMCSCFTGNKLRFESLPSDNGRLINQDV